MCEYSKPKFTRSSENGEELLELSVESESDEVAEVFSQRPLGQDFSCSHDDPAPAVADDDEPHIHAAVLKLL